MQREPVHCVAPWIHPRGKFCSEGYAIRVLMWAQHVNPNNVWSVLTEFGPKRSRIREYTVLISFHFLPSTYCIVQFSSRLVGFAFFILGRQVRVHWQADGAEAVQRDARVFTPQL